VLITKKIVQFCTARNKPVTRLQCFLLHVISSWYLAKQMRTVFITCLNDIELLNSSCVICVGLPDWCKMQCIHSVLAITQKCGGCNDVETLHII